MDKRTEDFRLVKKWIRRSFSRPQSSLSSHWLPHLLTWSTYAVKKVRTYCIVAQNVRTPTVYFMRIRAHWLGKSVQELKRNPSSLGKVMSTLLASPRALSSSFGYQMKVDLGQRRGLHSFTHSLEHISNMAQILGLSFPTLADKVGVSYFVREFLGIFSEYACVGLGLHVLLLLVQQRRRSACRGAS